VRSAVRQQRRHWFCRAPLSIGICCSGSPKRHTTSSTAATAPTTMPTTAPMLRWPLWPSWPPPSSVPRTGILRSRHSSCHGQILGITKPNPAVCRQPDRADTAVGACWMQTASLEMICSWRRECQQHSHVMQAEDATASCTASNLAAHVAQRQRSRHSDDGLAAPRGDGLLLLQRQQTSSRGNRCQHGRQGRSAQRVYCRIEWIRTCRLSSHNPSKSWFRSGCPPQRTGSGRRQYGWTPAIPSLTPQQPPFPQSDWMQAPAADPASSNARLRAAFIDMRYISAAGCAHVCSSITQDKVRTRAMGVGQYRHLWAELLQGIADDKEHCRIV
jgi:hypothetical protein